MDESLGLRLAVASGIVRTIQKLERRRSSR
jgi:hypothetical protein